MLLKELILDRKNTLNRAVHFRGESLNYQELYENVQAHAHVLSGKCKSSNQIGIFIPNSIDYVISFFTITFLDKIIVPLSIHSKKTELISTLEYCEIDILITDTHFVQKLQDYLKDFSKSLWLYDIAKEEFHRTGPVPETFRNEACSIQEQPEPDENSVALLLHTSGTTSNPKRVMLSHKNLIENARSIISSLQLNEKDITLVALPMTMASATTSQLLTHIYLGASIVILDGFFLPNIFFKLVAKHRVTNFTGVPFMMAELSGFRNKDSYDISSLKMICFGGGGSAVHKIKELLEAFPGIRFVHMYGQTEAAPRISHLLPEDAYRKMGSVGKPIPGVVVKIVDDSGTAVGTGQTGELTVQGPNVMRGYFKRCAETERVLKNGWLYTGDLARFDEDGYIYLVGRKKNVIICGGFNIYPEEIEEILLEHDSIKEARVFGITDELMGELPAAEVVLKEGAENTGKDKLMKYCFQKLAKYKIPREITIVGSLPRTESGKVVRVKGEANV